MLPRCFSLLLATPIFLLAAASAGWAGLLSDKDIVQRCSTAPEFFPFDNTRAHFDSIVESMGRGQSGDELYRITYCVAVNHPKQAYLIDWSAAQMNNVGLNRDGTELSSITYVKHYGPAPTVAYLGPNRERFEPNINREYSFIDVAKDGVEQIVTRLFASIPTQERSPQEHLTPVDLVFTAGREDGRWRLEYVNNLGAPVRFRFLPSLVREVPGLAGVREIGKARAAVTYELPTARSVEPGLVTITFENTDHEPLGSMAVVLYQPVR
ncbi:MAG TPA: hypothetical protein VN668_17645 [Stellaceae bacterium]|nr:hypothetical protein [Stellaceae bacterium]